MRLHADYKGDGNAGRLRPPYASVLDLIGQTPVVELTQFDTGLCRLFIKLESQNPGGSIKDRIALSMIAEAERSGRLTPHGTIVEATAGNTGLGLAQVGIPKGYRIVLVVPDKMSREKIQHLRALGAEVRLTRSDVGKGDPEYYQDMAERIAAETPGAFYVNQFANPANPLAHETTTGPEIWNQLEGDVDAIVVGVGSGGTLTGLGRYFRKVSPKTEMVLADPVGSVLAPLIKTGKMEEAGSWTVEGIGEDFVPPNADLSLVAEAYSITDKASMLAVRDLLSKEGHTGRFVFRHAAVRRPALLPRADRAKARADFRLRQRQQISVQGVRRFLACRTGAGGYGAAWRSQRSRRPLAPRGRHCFRWPRGHPAQRLWAHAASRRLATAGTR